MLTAADLGLMTSMFYAAFALAQLPLGVGLDRVGPRWVTPGLMLVGAVGSLVFALAPSFAVLALGRALIGVGMAGVLMGSLKAFSQWFPPHRFATMSGLLVGIGSSGALIAATPLAWLNQEYGWRTVFVGGAIITAVIAVMVMAWARNTPPGVPWEGRTQTQGGLRDVFRDGRFWRIAPHNFFMAGVLLSFQGLWAGPYLFDVLRLSDTAVGNVLLAMGIGATTGFLVSGWLADRLGVAQVVVGSSVLFVACQFGLVLRPPLVLVSGIYALFGLTGAFNIMLLAHARQVFPPTMTGQAVTAVNLFGIGGTFLLQWLLGVVIGAFPQDAAGHYPPLAHSVALLLMAVGTTLTLGWYLPLVWRGGRSAAAEGR
jgi:predicted MFS family arabinose efflux permease